MRIGLVGGVERSEVAYRDAAKRRGHELEFHSGHIGGRGSARLLAMGRSVDVMIVVTDINSHGAVHLARRAARSSGIPVELHRRVSPARFAKIVAEMPLATAAGMRSPLATATGAAAL
jgi:hypothetical protein